MKNFGSSSGNLPDQMCNPAMGSDTCPGVVTNPPQGTSISCDTATTKCVAQAELRLSYTVDLASQTSFPPQAIQLGVSAVAIKEVRYWVMQNTLAVGVPAIDLY